MDDLNQPQPGALSVVGIKIAESAIGDDTAQTVNARELHAFLGVGRDFSDWIKEKIRQYEFVLDVDYAMVNVPAPRNGGVGNRGARIDYHISLDMAKELAMVERNAKGREASRAFARVSEQLAVEKALANQQLTAVSTTVQAAVTQEQPMFLSDQFEAYLTLVEGEKDGKRQKLVDLSSLHQALEIKKDFTDWAKVSLADVGENHHPQEGVMVPLPQGGAVMKHVYLVTMETAKLIAARSRSAASLRICKWLVAVEEEARKRVEAELAFLQTPRSRIEMLELALEAERRAEAAEAEATAQRQIATQEIRRAVGLETRIASNVLIPRPQYEEATAGIPLTAIKRDIAPYLSIVVIRNILKYYGQKRVLTQFAPHENAVVKPFARDGVELAIQQFLEEAEQRISFSRKTVVLKHECLVGDEAQVSREDAIQYLGFTAEQFED